MIVKRAVILAGSIFLLGAVYSTQAQEGDELPPLESDWTGPMPTQYSKGDKILTLGAGTVFPAVFFDNKGNTYTHNIFAVGGMGFGGYSYFLSPHWFIGGELSGMFIGTLNKNSFLFMVPFGLLGGYQFVFGRFEFPLSLMLGMVAQQYLERGHFSWLFLKPSASVFWRFNPDWSFGVNAAWWWVPEWPEDAAKSRYGNFIELSLSARFHF
ncbi:MAG: hypothetical protein LBG76_01820 [Treponema sp.]|jgi:hypothetical protein|nr:hypothetical protein [Treponema sp.]